MPSPPNNPNKTIHPLILRCEQRLLGIYLHLKNELGLKDDRIHAIMEVVTAWLKSEHRMPNLWEGPEGWHKRFLEFGLEGDPDEPCPRRIYLRRFGTDRRWQGVDVDHPETWKKKPRS